MSNKNCTVCGLNKGVCKHWLEFRHKIRDQRVAEVFWFSMGFIVAMIILLIENLIS